MSLRSFLAPLALLVPVLTGCGTHDILPVAPYQSSGQIILDVAQIDIADDTRELGAGLPPRVDHLMSPTVKELVESWALSTFRAGGGSGRVVISIKDASVTRTGLPQTVGAFSEVVPESGLQLDGRIELDVRAEKPDTRFAATFQSVATYSLPLPDKTDAEDRLLGEETMKNALLWELDAQVSQGVLQYLDPLVIR